MFILAFLEVRNLQSKKEKNYNKTTYIPCTCNGNVVSIQQNLIKLCYSSPFSSDFTATQKYKEKEMRMGISTRTLSTTMESYDKKM